MATTFGGLTTALRTAVPTAVAPVAPTPQQATLAPAPRPTVTAAPAPTALGYTGPKPPAFSDALKAEIMAEFQPYLDSIKPVDAATQIAKLQAQLVTLPFGSPLRATITTQINLLKTAPVLAATVAQQSNLALSLRTGNLIPTWYKGQFVDVSQGATPQTGYLRYRILYRNGVKIWEVSRYFKLNEGNQTITDAMAAEGNGWHVTVGFYKTTYSYTTNAWGNTVEQPHYVVPLVDSFWFLEDPAPILKPGIIGAGYVPGISGRAITQQAAIGVASVVLPVVGGVVAAPLIFAGVGVTGAAGAAGAVAGAAATGAATGAGAAAGAVGGAIAGAGAGAAAGAVAAAATGAAIGGVAGGTATSIGTATGAVAGQAASIGSNVGLPAGVPPTGIDAAAPLANTVPAPNVGGGIGEAAGQAASQTGSAIGDTAASITNVPAVGGAAGSGAGSGSIFSNIGAQIGQIPSQLAKAGIGALVSKGLAKIMHKNTAEPVPQPRQAGFAEFFTEGTGLSPWLLLIPLLLLIALFFFGRRLQG